MCQNSPQRWIIRLLLIAMMGGWGAGHASAETLVTSLSSREVEITSTYTGAKLKVYGVIEKDSQTASRAQDYVIVVTVLGPRTHYTVREKARMGPAWINRSKIVFRDIPSYIAVLSSDSISQATSVELMRQFRLGLDLAMAPYHVIKDFPGESVRFFGALKRLGMVSGRYQQNEAAVTFMKIKDKKGQSTLTSSSLFEANIILPASVMTGTYNVDVALFADRTLLDRSITYFEVKKTGFEATIVNWVKEHSWSYGITMTLIALFFGWLASMIFRRD
jgi:uncharacterized protein (TIGR02186 family)